MLKFLEFMHIRFLLIFTVITLISCGTSKQTPRYNSAIISLKKDQSHNINEVRDNLVILASQQCGKPYKYGGKKPKGGFDCSGLITYVYDQVGVEASGASYHLAKQGKYKSWSELQPGDLLFFGNGNKVSHVAMLYSNKSSQIHVVHSTKSRGVVIDNISNSSYWQKRYLFSKDIVSLLSREELAGLD